MTKIAQDFYLIFITDVLQIRHTQNRCEARCICLLCDDQAAVFGPSLTKAHPCFDTLLQTCERDGETQNALL